MILISFSRKNKTHGASNHSSPAKNTLESPSGFVSIAVLGLLFHYSK